MPRDVALGTEPRQLVAMGPLAAPSTVLARARREFGGERLERLPLRARLLDVLEHLDRGQVLVMTGATVPSVWLHGHPDIAMLAGVLFTYGYVTIAGRHPDNAHIVYFVLSDDGRRKLREGRRWWNRLSFWQRLRVRLLG